MIADTSIAALRGHALCFANAHRIQVELSHHDIAFVVARSPPLADHSGKGPSGVEKIAHPGSVLTVSRGYHPGEMGLNESI